jgi:hypothetical protein
MKTIWHPFPKNPSRSLNGAFHPETTRLPEKRKWPGERPPGLKSHRRRKNRRADYLFVEGTFVEGVAGVSPPPLQPVRNMPLRTQASTMRESFNFIRR